MAIAKLFYKEEFTANEYVSACVYLSCAKAHGDDRYAEGNIRYTNGGYYDTALENKNTSWEIHRASQCGAANHYSLSDDLTSGTELRVDGLPETELPMLDILLRSDANGNGKADPGDWVSWRTHSRYGYNYYHYGEVTAMDASHPNRS